ncbi:MAG: fibrobacter succinogenes major paralogous domain-containing protein [Flavobacteriales bacterium]|nr:fibrobacter succinogenes major paralogous domain-containing protein [Flavobacteriales bacterium]
MKRIGEIHSLINRIICYLPVALVVLTIGCSPDEDDDDIVPNNRYECVNNNCVQDNNGSYASQSECNSVCVPRYNCVDGSCQEATSGTYSSLGLCETSCGNFTTAPGDGVTDVNGDHYPSIVFGNGQEWMGVNFGTGNFANGDLIPSVSSDTEWASLNEGAYSFNNSAVYYNWFAVEDPRNLCPTGWHVPSQAEFNELLTYLGSQNTAALMRTWGVQGNNASGFNALPTGKRLANGSYTGFNTSAYWWTSTQAEEEFGLGNAWNFNMLEAYSVVYSDPMADKNQGLSVRCVKD